MILSCFRDGRLQHKNHSAFKHIEGYTGCCYSSMQSLHTNVHDQSYLSSHSHSLTVKLFAKTNISLLKNLMGQGQILSAWWHLLSCKYWESLVRADSAPYMREQKKKKKKRVIRRDNVSRAQQVCIMFLHRSQINRHRHNLHIQFVIGVLSPMHSSLRNYQLTEDSKISAS